MSRSIVENLLDSADRFSDRAALQSGRVTLSFGSLLRRAQAVAAYLRTAGVDSGDRVAVVLPNSLEYVVAFYGALIAGAMVVPLNSLAKTRELTAWLDHCEATWLFAEKANAEVAQALARCRRSIEVVWVAEGQCDGRRFAEIADEGGDHGAVAIPDRSTPAAVFYTSGTTGRPKGVVLTHENLASNAEAIVRYLGLTEDDSIVNVLPLFYSYGNSVLQSHLLAGGKVILESNLVYPHAVVQALADNQCTGFAGVPSTYALLLARTRLREYDLSHLRYVTQAGGPMSPQLTERLRAALPDVNLIIMYGQTEATARLTYLPAADVARKRGSVGLPIPGVAIEIRDGSGRPVQSGEVGEVWASGPNVMLEYWRDEDATRSALRNGWLVTGDMGFIDSEGYLHLSGRRSDIIKVGAYRVFPLEVEEAIAEVPGVLEAAVVGADDEILGQVIRAYVVAQREGRPTSLQIQSHCREQLASYKVPKSVEFVEFLPKTDSGKVRRAELSSRVMV